jgi:hypothetical protein
MMYDRGRQMLRRWSLGLALSAVVHALLVGGVMALALVGAGVGPVDVEITGVGIEDLKDLPLGPPPGAARTGPARRAPRPRAPRAPDSEAGTLASRGDSAPAHPVPAVDEPDDTDDEAAARVSDLRQLGPEGSRMTALLRVDRLKATPYAAAVDQLLMRLPDRRDLFEGTGLEFYDTVDALLISTPNPRDPAVTFLAARHHLPDQELQRALDRGARATGHFITWRTERGRPFAERRARHGPPMTRSDDRIFVLAAPGLMVVTPPAYRALLLARPPPRPIAHAPDAGETGADAGVADSPSAPQQPPSWRALLRRIDAEDGLLPPTGIALLSMVDLFKPASDSPRDTPIFWGLPVPRIITAVLGADPEPFVEITGEFAAEAEARQLEVAWPGLRNKLRPYAVLAGLSGLVGRAELSREGRTVHFRETATTEEALRLLQLATSILGG